MIRPETGSLAPGRIARLGSWVARSGWVHVLLLSGAAALLYPMLWMVLTSLKTDDELAAPGLLPSLPRFHPGSPSVREPVSLPRPDAVRPAAWPDLRDKLLSAADHAIAPALPSTCPVDALAWRHAAASVAARLASARLDQGSWRDDDTALAALRTACTPELVAQALDDSLARCEVQGLQLYTNDAQLFPIASGTALSRMASVESGPATLTAIPAGLRVDYHFASSSDRPVVLAVPFDLPEGVAAADVHKLVVTLLTDDSWHRLDASLDAGGTRWVTTRDTPLAQHRQTTVTFQPPGFDDGTYKNRSWIPLRAIGASPGTAPARHCLLRLCIVPSSTAQACWQKATRNYQRAFRAVPFWTYLGNSVLLVVLVVAGSLFSSAFVAYAFARLSWPGRSIAFMLLLSTMMLPSQVTMVPSFLVWRELGWYNTLNPLWIGAWLGNAFYIFLMVQHLKTIPRELEEAARIDGLNTVQTWWYIIVPQLTPTLAAIAIMSFVAAWNEFMGPLIYLRDQSRFPLSLGLFGMKVENTGVDFGMMMAGDMLMTVPAILVFFCFQRYFIQGLTVSGMKG